jgi:hypothetical protein
MEVGSKSVSRLLTFMMAQGPLRQVLRFLFNQYRSETQTISEHSLIF